ncbi:hypothetical protein JY651_03610 [Pyxidicoccus parkwayensis]|uniref:Uncharacterized protein n=1 Tax=Pyxidicoccus parkwayensis TaxID=2813578 RepID=A0ABX7NZC3_9BACT|nr:hypothetical protein [Pyxidicoccus parkwaysis]QSQ24078.1 hypothetical protein JY651_03610 [Pyxidicoccus parkwaysis]
MSSPNDSRAPEQMPTDWVVARFEYARGLGAISREGEAEVGFDMTAWRYDPTAQSRKEIHGAASWPQPGEPVAVTWKRSAFSGRVVPALIVPTSRKAARKRHRPGTWLKAVTRITGHFSGLTLKKLNGLLSQPGVEISLEEQFPADDEFEAEELAELLHHVAILRGLAPDAYREHAAWLYADDHRWDRQDAAAHLPPLLGLPPSAVEPAPDDSNESLTDYAARLNALAETRALPLRLHSLAHDSDFELLAALTPAQMAKLEKDRYLVRWGQGE